MENNLVIVDKRKIDSVNSTFRSIRQQIYQLEEEIRRLRLSMCENNTPPVKRSKEGDGVE